MVQDERIDISIFNAVYGKEQLKELSKTYDNINVIAEKTSKKFQYLGDGFKKIKTTIDGVNAKGEEYSRVTTREIDTSAQLIRKQEMLERVRQKMAEGLATDEWNAQDRQEKMRASINRAKKSLLDKAHATGVLAKKNAFLSEWSEKLGVNTARVAEIMGKMGLVFNKNADITDKAGKKVGNLSGVMHKGLMETTKFNSALLGTMFAGMALSRAMSGVIRPVTQLLGWSEILGGMFQMLLLPVLLPLTEILIQISGWFMNLSESQRKWIGSLIIAVFVFGSLLAIISMAALGFNALVDVVDKFIPEEMLNNLSVFGFTLGELPGALGESIMTFGVLGGIIAAFTSIIGIGTNFLNGLGDSEEETGEKSTSMGQKIIGMISSIGGKIKGFVDGIGDKFSGVSDIIFNENISLWDKVKTTIKTSISWIKDEIVEGMKTAWDKLKTYLPDWAVEGMEKAWESITTFITDIKNADSIGGALFAMVKLIKNWGAIGKYIAKQMVSGIVDNLFGGEDSPFPEANIKFPKSSSYSYIPELPGFQTGGMIPETGPYMLHKGEAVERELQNEISINMNNTFNVSDKEEMEKMLNENNIKLSDEINRLIGV